MVYSAIKDNWVRVQCLHQIAHDLWQQTHDTEFRSRTLNNGDAFPFNIEACNIIKKEASIVEMLMAWSVMSIESLVNHALAEKINNRVLAIIAIEYPSKAIDTLKIKNTGNSELSKKISILFDNTVSGPSKIIRLADEISSLRNSIVHDKPYELMFDGEDYFVEHFRIRESTKPYKYYYEDLTGFFIKCDKMVTFILSHSGLSEDIDTHAYELKFSSFING